MKSLRRHLTSRLLLAFTLVLGASSALIYVIARIGLYRELDARLKVEMTAMAVFTRPGREKVEFEFPKKARSVEDASQTADYYQLFGTDGESLLRSPTLGHANLPRRLGSLSKPVLWNLTLPDGTPGRAIGVQFTAKVPEKEKKPPSSGALSKPEDLTKPKPPRPLPPLPPPPVEVGLVLAEDRSQLDQTLGTLASILVGANLLALLATVLLIPPVLRACLAPVQRLAAQAESIEATSLKFRFPTGDLPVELAPIAHRANDLLARLENSFAQLEDSFARERRFSADLAHELRTPIAELRTLAEVGLDSLGPNETSKGALQEALDISRQMEGLAEGLLAIARCEAGQQPVVRQPVLMASIVDEAWQPFAQQAAAKQLVFAKEIQPKQRFETDPALFGSILQNLISNAVEYSPPAGMVRIAYVQDGARFSLAIANRTDELAAGDLPKLFQRFWRKDPARGSTQHSGLGLALAQALAGRLGLRLEAALSSAPSATMLTLSLTGPVD
ncbi:MAG: hypothetical protein HY735_31065 [Verrucomicrobia bacterium]|nr:hypothetical protein [Verrucomicrobiota bacterium]